jgi:GNAT superfamily N-acetyltransferase
VAAPLLKPDPFGGPERGRVTQSTTTSRIRQATPADIDMILHHRRSMFADMGEGSETDLDVMVARARQFIETALKDGSYRGWLVEVGGRVVAGGGVAIVGYQPSPLETSPGRAFVLNMYTEPAFRRQGLARQILKTIVEWCRQQGFAAVSLHASDAGRALYSSLGFEPTNEMRLVLRQVERGRLNKGM